MPSRQPPGPPAASAVTLPEPDTTAVAALPHHHSHQPLLFPLVATAAAAFAALSLAAAAVLAVLLFRRLSRTAPADLKSSPTPPAGSPAPEVSSHLRRFSYGQLRRATVSFAPSHRLGQGGFGPVFRGALPSGEEVAVKLMDAGSLQGEREFQNELALAGNILAAGQSPSDRGFVVAPLGFCSSDAPCRRWWRRRWWPWPPPSPPGAVREAAEGRRLLLVYELMHKGSLQDALLGRRCPELAEWVRRFAVALDVARGLHFLHAVCDPPVIHGDIKPSNILLDAQFNAKIADFGLARLKTAIAVDDPAADGQLDEMTAAEIDTDTSAAAADDSKLVAGRERKKEPMTEAEVGDDDASVIGGETAESTTTGFEEPVGIREQGLSFTGNGSSVTHEKSPDEDEGFTTASPVETAAALEAAASTSEGGGGFDRASVDSGRETVASGSRRGGRKKGGVLSGKDWWWRQDASGGGNSESGGSVKDYVMEWIRSEIKKERPKSDWIAASTPPSAEDGLQKPPGLGRPERKKQPRRLEWWAALDEERLKKKDKCRPAREWWREEFCEELTNKQKQRAMARSRSNIEGGGEQQWRQYDDGFGPHSERRKRRKKKSFGRGSRASADWWMDGISGEIRSTGRRCSRDWASGDIPKSGTVSSTPSMRGTVCYVAPEYGGGGPLSEKCDIYSYGVLLLVLISGRRPLQVTASPMSEFERANLISWARQLAHMGRLMDLLDPSLRAVDRDQALLCITIALLCIQRSPARRPSSKEILLMLTGQSEPPHLPFEFSPSPPGGFTFKSRKKAR